MDADQTESPDSIRGGVECCVVDSKWGELVSNRDCDAHGWSGLVAHSDTPDVAIGGPIPRAIRDPMECSPLLRPTVC